MKISDEGLSFIKAFEDFSAVPYRCPAGKQTIGYGHVMLAGETFTELTESEAVELLRSDCAKCERAINQQVKVDINRHQFDALVSLTFNIGLTAFFQSTLLKLLNKGEYLAAADQFPRWNKATVNGVLQELPGLTTRRQLERCLFLTPTSV